MTARLHPDADAEIDAAARWYQDQVYGLGEQFLDEVGDALYAIERHPQRFGRYARAPKGNAVARALRRMQTWAWGAIVLDLPSLGGELESRYALSDAQPETELGWDPIPGGIVVTCEVLLRGREC